MASDGKHATNDGTGSDGKRGGEISAGDDGRSASPLGDVAADVPEVNEGKLREAGAPVGGGASDAGDQDFAEGARGDTGAAAGAAPEPGSTTGGDMEETYDGAAHGGSSYSAEEAGASIYSGSRSDGAAATAAHEGDGGRDAAPSATYYAEPHRDHATSYYGGAAVASPGSYEHVNGDAGAVGGALAAAGHYGDGRSPVSRAPATHAWGAPDGTTDGSTYADDESATSATAASGKSIRNREYDAATEKLEAARVAAREAKIQTILDSQSTLAGALLCKTVAGRGVCVVCAACGSTPMPTGTSYCGFAVLCSPL